MNDPEQLASVVKLARETKSAVQLWVRRCDTQHGGRCLMVGAFDIRGQAVVLAGKVRFPHPAQAEEMGVERVTPARAWLLPDVPSEPILVGCRHERWWAEIDHGHISRLILT